MITLEFSLQDILYTKILPLLISTAILGLLKKYGALSWNFILSRIEIPKQLKTYHGRLLKTILDQTHFWNHDGPQLKELTLPINLCMKDAVGNETETFPLERFIFSEFGQKDVAPRLVICGNAGSGKSVALGVIAQFARSIPSNRVHQPVLLRIQEIKDVKDEESMVKIVIDKLRVLQFEEGKRKGSAEKFIREHLFSGRILLLLDGFDEVAGNLRQNVATFLCTFFSIHLKIPFIMTTRKAVWEKDKILFRELKPKLLWIARLEHAEIKIFLWRWSYPEYKSADQLYQLILEKRYLDSISRNPLILNIIAYIYTMTDRTLPDGKVDFFRECVDALLEKWDNQQARVRENLSFVDKNGKIKVLNRIAFANLVEAQYQSIDFLENDAAKQISAIEFDPPLPQTEKQKIITELVLNAELLVRTLPKHLAFSHQSFMEYFAANEAVLYHYEDLVLQGYFRDKTNREDLLAMLVGLDLNIEQSDDIFEQLIQDYQLNGNSFVFAALSEATVVSPQIAIRVLQLAYTQLLKRIDSDIATSLGYVAINGKQPHHQEAKNVLLAVGELNSAYSAPEFYSLCKVVMDFNFEKVIEWTKNRFEGRIPKELVKTLAKNAPQKASKIVESVDTSDLQTFLEGLLEAGELNVIFDLACNGKSEQLLLEAAIALSSKFKDFDIGGAIKHTLDEIEYDRITKSDIRTRVEQTYLSFGWPKSASRLGPLTEKSKRIFFALCHLLADRVSPSGTLVEELYVRIKATASNEMNYVLGAILHEKGIKFQTLALFGTQVPATSIGLRRLWKYRDWGLGAVFLLLLTVGYAPTAMMSGFSTATTDAASYNASVWYFLYGWTFLLFVTFDVAGLRLPKAVHLCHALFSPYWSFSIYNSKRFKDHWISKFGLPQCAFLALSASIHGYLTWPPSETTWVSGWLFMPIVVITGIILSSFLTRFSGLFPNEAIRREISTPWPRKETEDFQITMLLSHLMTLIVGTRKARSN